MDPGVRGGDATLALGGCSEDELRDPEKWGNIVGFRIREWKYRKEEVVGVLLAVEAWRTDRDRRPVRADQAGPATVDRATWHRMDTSVGTTWGQFGSLALSRETVFVKLRAN